MHQKQAVQLDANGYFTGLTIADESPLEPGIFLLPALAVFAEVPDVPAGMRAKWVEGGWLIEAIPVPAPEPEPEPEPEPYYDLRKDAYRSEADPLFFLYQRGEATREDWLAKVAEIRARYPKPD